MQKIDFHKTQAGPGSPATLVGVTKLRFGAYWETSTQGRSGWMGKLTDRTGLDIDLVAILMQGDGDKKKAVKYVGLDNLDPVDGTVKHTGDAKKGNKKAKVEKDSEGRTLKADVEAIEVLDLTKVDLDYNAIFFTVSVMKQGALATGLAQGLRDADPARAAELLDKGFQGAKNVEFSVYMDGSDGPEYFKIMPDLAGKENCCLIAKVSRTHPTDKMAPWAIEIFEDMVMIEKGDKAMGQLLDHCRQR